MLSRSHADKGRKPPADALIEETFEAYDGWLKESLRVRDCYARWLAASRCDAACAFAAYNAALDREESAATHYRELTSRVEDASLELSPLAGARPSA